MYTADNRCASEVNNALIALFLVLIAYSHRFKHRADWVSLKTLVFHDDAERWFRKNLVTSKKNDRVTANLSDSSVKAFVYFYHAAIGERRLLRRITNEGVVFFSGDGHPVELKKLYFYDYQVDFGPYRRLPPFVGRLLSPFRDYFEIHGGTTSFDENSFWFDDPIISSPIGEVPIKTLRFIFAGDYQLTQLLIKWSSEFQIEVFFDMNLVKVNSTSHGILEFKLSELSDSLSEITLLFSGLLNVKL